MGVQTPEAGPESRAPELEQQQIAARRGDGAAGDLAHEDVLGREHRAPHDLPLPFSARGLSPEERFHGTLQRRVQHLF